MRDPHEAIREGENALRALLENVLSREFGTDWLNKSGLSPERLIEITRRKEVEQKKRPLQKAEQRSLYYADIFDLTTIIEKQWMLIKPVLGDKKETEVFLDKLEDLRNPDSHQRGLWPYEIDLAFGISGHFRQALAVAQAEHDELDKYYPRFERVVDSFGNAIVHPQEGITTAQTVRPGTEIAYQIEAWNPTTEPIEFSSWLSLWERELHPRTLETSLHIKLEKSDIGRTVLVRIYLHQAGSKKGFDEQAMFVYRGIPEI